MKGQVIVALIVGALLGAVVTMAVTPDKEKAPAVAQAAQPAAAKAPEAAKPPPRGGSEDPNAVYKVPVGDSPTFGPATAKVTIIEATDFQCPFCTRANTTVKQLTEQYGKDLRVVVKQNPLGFHQHAHLAAQAALAAHEQGKYWEMHHRMFDNQQALDRASLEKHAQEIGLNMERFKQALDTQKFKDRIDAEQKLVVGLGAGGTPSFFINGRKLVGAQPIERFKEIIDEEIKKADALLARGVRPEAIYEETIRNGATRPVMLPGQPEAAPERAAPAPAVQKIEVPDYAPFMGPKHAKVTIVEWSDFECPFCSRGAAVAKEILAAYPKDVKFVFRHQPLPFHQRATPAAKASIAAHRQGKFFEMHDKMFANAKELTDANFEVWAKELGLDMAKFKADMASAETADQVKKDSEYGNKVGANGTPTFFVNGRKVEGAQPFASFKSIIDQEIARADELMKAGTKIDQVYEKLTAMAAPEPPKVAMAPGNAPFKGNKKAPVQIYEFSEFQCPFCSRVNPTIKQIQETYGDKVVIYFKNQPLPFHNNAQIAAEAGLAANEQGKFWEMHDKMFANQNALDRANLEKYAQELGLNMAKFKAALDSGKFKEQIKQDMAQAAGAGISGTPSFVINGQLLVGAQPFEAFQKIIDEELAKGKQAAK